MKATEKTKLISSIQNLIDSLGDNFKSTQVLYDPESFNPIIGIIESLGKNKTNSTKIGSIIINIPFTEFSEIVEAPPTRKATDDLKKSLNNEKLSTLIDKINLSNNTSDFILYSSSNTSEYLNKKEVLSTPKMVSKLEGNFEFRGNGTTYDPKNFEPYSNIEFNVSYEIFSANDNVIEEYAEKLKQDFIKLIHEKR
jgi:hypothetical protein